MGRRLLRAAIAILLLLAFFADQRVVAPVAAVIVALGAWRGLLPRVESAIAVLVLAGATVAFEAGQEVLAWGLTLAVAAFAGFEAATSMGRPAPARRDVGSSSRGR